jgi:hypothetical protein
MKKLNRVLNNERLLLAGLELLLNKCLGMLKLINFNGRNYGEMDNRDPIKNSFTDEINYYKNINDYENLIKYIKLQKIKICL